MNLSYLITPFFTWFLTGCIKFAINSIKEKRLAFDLIGYGGMPSNHSAIVSSAVVIIVFQEGIESPVLVVALALAFIVILDANNLRQQIGKHAKAINSLSQSDNMIKLRERMGHTRLEILSGIMLGFLSAVIVNLIFKY